MAEDDLEPDARDCSLLDTAARLADRMAGLDVMIDADGERSVSESGIVHLRPGIAEFRHHSIALSKVLVAVAFVKHANDGIPSWLSAPVWADWERPEDDTSTLAIEHTSPMFARHIASESRYAAARRE